MNVNQIAEATSYLVQSLPEIPPDMDVGDLAEQTFRLADGTFVTVVLVTSEESVFNREVSATDYVMQACIRAEQSE